METTVKRRPASEITRLGKAIYDREIRDKVEPAENERIAAVDINSGDYAVADSVLEAAEQVRQRRPEAELYLVRVGYDYLHKMRRR